MRAGDDNDDKDDGKIMSEENYKDGADMVTTNIGVQIEISLQNAYLLLCPGSTLCLITHFKIEVRSS